MQPASSMRGARATRTPTMASPRLSTVSISKPSPKLARSLQPHTTGRPARVTCSAVLPNKSGAVRDYDGGYGSNSRRNTTTSAPPPAQPPSIDALLADLSPDEQRTVRLFQDNSRSVVNVSTTRQLPAFLNPFGLQQVPRGVGSGFVWDKNGHIVTNAHVVAGAVEVAVTLSDGTRCPAKVVGRDKEKDLAVLCITGMSPAQLAALRPVVLGTSSNLLVGQKLFAIGNPFGLDQTLTSGIVSGLGREVSTPGSPFKPAITNGIQTDCAINPGNSGGPLLDSLGRVVGINTAILDPTGVGISSGVGFAISIDAVRGMIEQLLTVGRIVRPALGISIAPVPPQLQQKLARLGLIDEPTATNGGRPGQGGGVLVVTVRPGGPADVAGIQATRQDMMGGVRLGDVVVGVDNKPVRNQKDLFALLDTHQVGDAIEVTLVCPSTLVKRVVRVVLADRDRLAGSE